MHVQLADAIWRDDAATVRTLVTRNPALISEHVLVSTDSDWVASLPTRGTSVAALLTPASVKAMKTNHLAGSQRAGRDVILGHGRGWGYGMSVGDGYAIPGQRIGFIWLDWRLRHFVARLVVMLR